jgi:single-stranded DNA-binding protein
MNQVFVCAQTAEAPREVYTSATSTALRCNVLLPPVGNKAPTQIELNVYGKNSDRFARTPKGALIYIHGAKLRFDLESRTYSLHGGVIATVNESFPIFNTVILSGRCVKDIQQDDARAFKTTADGLMICNQTLSVNTGRNQADLFNFYAINSHEDKLNNAQLLVDFTRKGTGLTIQGRLVTDAWTDKDTNQRRSITKIQLVSMTLAPKASSGSSGTTEIKAQTVVAQPDKVAPLWGGKTVEDGNDPWNTASGGGLPDLPGQYGSAPDLEEAPF